METLIASVCESFYSAWKLYANWQQHGLALRLRRKSEWGKRSMLIGTGMANELEISAK